MTKLIESAVIACANKAAVKPRGQSPPGNGEGALRQAPPKLAMRFARPVPRPAGASNQRRPSGLEGGAK
jgi:hypothetical protein